jgi:hypothetical protein
MSYGSAAVSPDRSFGVFHAQAPGQNSVDSNQLLVPANIFVFLTIFAEKHGIGQL